MRYRILFRGLTARSLCTFPGRTGEGGLYFHRLSAGASNDSVLSSVSQKRKDHHPHFLCQHDCDKLYYFLAVGTAGYAEYRFPCGRFDACSLCRPGRHARICDPYLRGAYRQCTGSASADRVNLPEGNLSDLCIDLSVCNGFLPLPR